MKKQKGLIAGLIILILLIGAYFLLKSLNLDEEETETGETEEETVYETDSSEISQLTVEADGNTCTFEQAEETWSYPADSSFPLNEDTLTNKVSNVTNVTASRIIEDIESLEDFGLESPAVKITVKKTDGTENTLELGDDNDAVSGCYMLLDGDDSKVYLVDSSLKSNMQFALSDLAEKEEIPSITGSTITSVRIENEEGTKTLAKDENSETGWTYTGTDGTASEAGSSLVQEYTNNFSSLYWSDYVSSNTEDLASYGLENPIKITIDYEEEETVESEDEEDSEEDSETSETEEDSEEEEETVTVQKQAVLLLGSQDEDGNYYGKMPEQNYIYTLSSSTAEGILSMEKEDFLDTKVSNYSYADMNKTTFVRNGETHVLTKETEEVESENDEGETETNTETSYYVDGKEVDITDVSGFYSKITELELQERADDNAEPEGESEFSVTFEKQDGINVTTDYYSYDSNFYLVIDSKGNHMLVNKMKVKEILDAYDEFIAGLDE